MAGSEGKNVMVEGRIVWVGGDLFKGKVNTIFGTQTPKLNQAGEQTNVYSFGLAVPKTGALTEIWNAMHEEAYKLYPSRQIPPAFAMKYKDGDNGIDDQGRPYNQRTGYTGSIVLSLSTTIMPKYFRWENGSYLQIADGIKCGDYVRVQVNVKAHPAIGAGKPGLYLNQSMVLFLGYGEEIVNTPSGEQVFGTQAPSLPPGASATPIGPAQGFPQAVSAPPPGLAAWQNQATPGFNQPAPQMQPQVAPAPVQPHYGVMPQSHQPQQQAAPQGFAPMPGFNGQPQAQPAPGFGTPPGYPQPAQNGMPPVPGFGQR